MCLRRPHVLTERISLRMLMLEAQVTQRFFLLFLLAVMSSLFLVKMHDIYMPSIMSMKYNMRVILYKQFKNIH